MRAGFNPSGPGRALTCAALAALVFCSRAWLIRAGGSVVPFWDQWDAEAINLYLPWLKGTLRWQDLFQAHNEHRILLTRLADLALFVSLGGWNPWAQMLFNALLHAAAAAGLAAVFWPAWPPRSRAVYLASLAVLFMATCGWQNALWGFQSQVYFANLLTIGAIAGLCAGPPLGVRWWLGWGAAGLALFANAGGLLAAGAVLGVELISALRTPRPWRTWGAVALIAAVVVLGISLRAGVPRHAPLQAHSAGQFLAVFTRCLAWPWVDRWAFCLVMQLPLAWLVFSRWRRREPLDAAGRCALALGLFAVLQSAAIAYSRGAGLPDSRPLSRYQDPLLLGVAAQLFATVQLFAGRGRAERLAMLLWGGVAFGGLIGLTETNLTLHLPYKRTQDQASLAMVRAYMATGDASVFTRDPLLTGPHPDPRVVQHVLDEPTLRATLPAALRAAEDSPATAPPWVVRHGPALTAASGILLLALLLCLLRPDSSRPRPAESAQTGRLQRAREAVDNDGELMDKSNIDTREP